MFTFITLMEVFELKVTYKSLSFILVLFIFLFSWVPNVSHAAEGKSINFEVLKYNTNDTSMANDYFEKPAKLIEKDGKKVLQITVNHSHWITGMSIDGHKEKIINKDASKDIRTSEFELSKASGKVNGTISVYINEPVNGKPFKYDHHYNITFKFDGKDSGATGSPNIVQDKSNVENPQTSGGIPTYTYLIPIVSLFALITISVMTFKLKKGNQ